VRKCALFFRIAVKLACPSTIRHRLPSGYQDSGTILNRAEILHMNAVSKKRKLVQILRSASYGGVETHVYDIMRMLDRRYYDVILVALTNLTVSDKFRDLGIKIICLNDTEWMSPKSLLSVMPLLRLLRCLKPDMVHLHGTRPIFIGSIAARLAGLSRIVSTVHSSYQLMALDVAKSRQRRMANLGRMTYLIGLLLSTKVITVSSFLGAECRDIVSILPGFLTRRINDKIVTIYHGVDTSRYAGNTSRHKPAHDNCTVIGTVSRLDEPKKGIAVLIHSLHSLLARNYKVRLKIAGDGPSLSELENIVRLYDLEKHVEFCGFCSDVPNFLRGIDIFVLPSLCEGFGLVNLEALAAGLPVVASDTGGVSEAVHDGINGLLVPPGDVAALAHKIAYLLENRDIHMMLGENGKKTVTDHFELKININRVLALYDEMFLH